MQKFIDARCPKPLNHEILLKGIEDLCDRAGVGIYGVVLFGSGAKIVIGKNANYRSKQPLFSQFEDIEFDAEK